MESRCFRHSRITDDSHYLTEYDLKKKVRWTIGSKQGARYIKPNWGSELKYKILEHDGIRVVNKEHKNLWQMSTCQQV
ncbi:MAG TPA: hypothetical protein VEL11_04970 [Candidatus Bathyarchaeia archaeon]|nr:hypothetical protein [Candidatus Bathyarchaeia archaeon]